MADTGAVEMKNDDTSSSGQNEPNLHEIKAMLVDIQSTNIRVGLRCRRCVVYSLTKRGHNIFCLFVSASVCLSYLIWSRLENSVFFLTVM